MNISKELDKFLACNFPALWTSQLHRCLPVFLILLLLEFAISWFLIASLSFNNILLTGSVFLFINLIYWQAQVNFVYEINLSFKRVFRLYFILLFSSFFTYLFLLIIPYVLQVRTQRLLAKTNLNQLMMDMRLQLLDQNDINTIKTYVLFPETILNVTNDLYEFKRDFLTRDFLVGGNHSPDSTINGKKLISLDAGYNADTLIPTSLYEQKKRIAAQTPAEQITIPDKDYLFPRPDALKRLISLTPLSIEALNKSTITIAQLYGIKPDELNKFDEVNIKLTGIINNSSDFRNYLNNENIFLLIMLIFYIPAICMMILLGQRSKFKVLRVAIPVSIYSIVLHIFSFVMLFVLTFDIFSDKGMEESYYAILIAIVLALTAIGKFSPTKTPRVFLSQLLHLQLLFLPLFLNFHEAPADFFGKEVWILLLIFLFFFINYLFFKIYHRMQYLPATN